MFTLFVDDSGTSLQNPVAIASALIIPATKIIRLEDEWNRFRAKEGFDYFHTSEFMFRNKKSEFAKWEDDKWRRVFRRVRQIGKKYGRGFSMAVNKKDYDEVAPPEFRRHAGEYHYTWAVRQLIAYIERDGLSARIPRQFVFQWMEKHLIERKEVEMVMDQNQFMADREGLPGSYEPNFSKSRDVPGLQLVDAVAWISYQYALRQIQGFTIQNEIVKELVAESWKDFGIENRTDGWLRAVTLKRDALENGIQSALANTKAMEFFVEWEEARRQNNARTVKGSA
jgi:hypothetical protein